MQNGPMTAWTQPLLSELLDPISPTQFADEYWVKRSILMRGDAAKLYRILPCAFSLDILRGALSGTTGKLFAYGETKTGTCQKVAAPEPLDRVLEQAGLGLFVPSLGGVFPAMNPWTRELKSQMGFSGPLDSEAFVGGRNGRVLLHMDPFSV